MKKKILAILLTVAMLTAAALPVFADEEPCKHENMTGINICDDCGTRFIQNHPSVSRPYVTVYNKDNVVSYQWYVNEDRIPVTDKNAFPVGDAYGKLSSYDGALWSTVIPSHVKEKDRVAAFSIIMDKFDRLVVDAYVLYQDGIRAKVDINDISFAGNDIRTESETPHDCISDQDKNEVTVYVKRGEELKGEEYEIAVSAYLYDHSAMVERSEEELFVPVEDETSFKLSSGKRYAKYLCEVTFKDGTVLRTNSFAYQNTVTKSPVLGDFSIEVTDADSAEYQWYREYISKEKQTAVTGLYSVSLAPDGVYGARDTSGYTPEYLRSIIEEADYIRPSDSESVYYYTSVYLDKGIYGFLAGEGATELRLLGIANTPIRADAYKADGRFYAEIKQHGFYTVIVNQAKPSYDDHLEIISTDPAALNVSQSFNYVSGKGWEATPLNSSAKNKVNEILGNNAVTDASAFFSLYSHSGAFVTVNIPEKLDGRAFRMINLSNGEVLVPDETDAGKSTFYISGGHYTLIYLGKVNSNTYVNAAMSDGAYPIVPENYIYSELNGWTNEHIYYNGPSHFITKPFSGMLLGGEYYYIEMYGEITSSNIEGNVNYRYIGSAQNKMLVYAYSDTAVSLTIQSYSSDASAKIWRVKPEFAVPEGSTPLDYFTLDYISEFALLEEIKPMAYTADKGWSGSVEKVSSNNTYELEFIDVALTAKDTLKVVTSSDKVILSLDGKEFFLSADGEGAYSFTCEEAGVYRVHVISKSTDVYAKIFKNDEEVTENYAPDSFSSYVNKLSSVTYDKENGWAVNGSDNTMYIAVPDGITQFVFKHGNLHNSYVSQLFFDIDGVDFLYNAEGIYTVVNTSGKDVFFPISVGTNGSVDYFDMVHTKTVYEKIEGQTGAVYTGKVEADSSYFVVTSWNGSEFMVTSCGRRSEDYSLKIDDTWDAYNAFVIYDSYGALESETYNYKWYAYGEKTELTYENAKPYEDVEGHKAHYIEGRGWAITSPASESALLRAELKEGDVLTYNSTDFGLFLENEKGERIEFETNSDELFTTIPENGLYTLRCNGHIGSPAVGYIKIYVHNTEDASLIRDNYSNVLKNGVDRTYYRCEVRLPDGRVIWDVVYFENTDPLEESILGQPSIVPLSEAGATFQWYEIIHKDVDGVNLGNAAQNDTETAKYNSEHKTWTPVLNSTDGRYHFFTVEAKKYDELHINVPNDAEYNISSLRIVNARGIEQEVHYDSLYRSLSCEFSADGVYTVYSVDNNPDMAITARLTACAALEGENESVLKGGIENKSYLCVYTLGKDRDEVRSIIMTFSATSIKEPTVYEPTILMNSNKGITIEWYADGELLAGETSATLSVIDKDVERYTYKVSVYGGDGTAKPENLANEFYGGFNVVEATFERAVMVALDLKIDDISFSAREELEELMAVLHPYYQTQYDSPMMMRGITSFDFITAYSNVKYALKKLDLLEKEIDRIGEDINGYDQAEVNQSHSLDIQRLIDDTLWIEGILEGEDELTAMAELRTKATALKAQADATPVPVPDDDGNEAPDDENQGGNTDGGNTDGGNTDGGNTDGGNTDGGNTDGGNTDGDNTDGGNTDGDNTDGDNTDGGNEGAEAESGEKAPENNGETDNELGSGAIIAICISAAAVIGVGAAVVGAGAGVGITLGITAKRTALPKEKKAKGKKAEKKEETDIQPEDK